MQAPFAFERLEGAIKDRQMFLFESALDDALTFRNRHIFDGVMFIDVRQNLLGLFRGITQLLQSRPDRLVDNLEHPSSGQKLVFYQGDVWLNSGRIAIHQKADSTGRGQDRDLRVPESVL